VPANSRLSPTSPGAVRLAQFQIAAEENYPAPAPFPDIICGDDRECDVDDTIEWNIVRDRGWQCFGRPPVVLGAGATVLVKTLLVFERTSEKEVGNCRCCSGQPRPSEPCRARRSW